LGKGGTYRPKGRAGEENEEMAAFHSDPGIFEDFQMAFILSFPNPTA
jgi:hypothetical protein